MMTLLLAAAAATARPVPMTDPDLRCMAAYLVVAGEANEDKTVTAEDRSGIQSIVMYFFGKVDARHPGADLKSTIQGLVQSPGYAVQLKPDVERCSAEAAGRGDYLQSFGDEEPAPAKP
jgi:hypothetical protein